MLAFLCYDETIIGSSRFCRKCCPLDVNGNIILAAIVLVYLLVGAVVFVRLDETLDSSEKSTLEKDREKIVAGLERDLNLSGSNLTYIVHAYLNRLESVLLKSELPAQTLRRKDGSWSYGRAFMLSVTTISTIGYGNTAPSTVPGRLFCVFYSIIGIPLFLLFLSNCGAILVKTLERLGSTVKTDMATQGCGLFWFCRRRSVKSEWLYQMVGDEPCDTEIEMTSESSVGIVHHDSSWDGDCPRTVSASEIYRSPHWKAGTRECLEGRSQEGRSAFELGRHADYSRTVACTTCYEQHARETPPANATTLKILPAKWKVLLILSIVFIIYITVTSICIYFAEPYWGVIDSLYYCVVTFTTIGYGDLVLTSCNTSLFEGNHLMPVAISVFIIIGMILLSACFALAQEKLMEFARAVVRRLESCRLCRCRRKSQSFHQRSRNGLY
ncbi:potassium channel subfamily K member 18-like isoform X1 [Ptychodera flava]|uniref:potassium channel subfamily K member 18-like isoform X1 n=1 Tax=Ptychodera flava TaxID=63121 RepID=UPI00396A6BD7